jgi:hypothetical protein
VSSSGFTICHFLKCEQPGGMATDARCTLAKHDLSDVASSAAEPLITHVDRHSTECHDPGRVQDAHNLGRHLDTELSFERCRRVGQSAHLEELPATTGLEDA